MPLNACIAVPRVGTNVSLWLQLLILSGWWSHTASPAAEASSSSVASWTTQQRGVVVESAASAAPGMLPGEPLWSGDATSGGPSGWAPYWAGRFELLQQVSSRPLRKSKAPHFVASGKTIAAPLPCSRVFAAAVAALAGHRYRERMTKLLL